MATTVFNCDDLRKNILSYLTIEKATKKLIDYKIKENVEYYRRYQESNIFACARMFHLDGNPKLNSSDPPLLLKGVDKIKYFKGRFHRMVGEDALEEIIQDFYNEYHSEDDTDSEYEGERWY